mmetsp:Transcript_27679/g.77555  ORF Transcript_27679/g.77555 Transcript_27679/m.77555 type:complete len:226 (-) Transcript_27679:85-762(-)
MVESAGRMAGGSWQEPANDQKRTAAASDNSCPPLHDNWQQQARQLQAQRKHNASIEGNHRHHQHRQNQRCNSTRMNSDSSNNSFGKGSPLSPRIMPRNDYDRTGEDGTRAPTPTAAPASSTSMRVDVRTHSDRLTITAASGNAAALRSRRMAADEEEIGMPQQEYDRRESAANRNHDRVIEIVDSVLDLLLDEDDMMMLFDNDHDTIGAVTSSSSEHQHHHHRHG